VYLVIDWVTVMDVLTVKLLKFKFNDVTIIIFEKRVLAKTI